MNIENKRQLATILLAVGLGLVASMLMSKVVSDKVERQTKIIAKEYQGKSAALIKEIDSTKRTLNTLAKQHAALAKKVAQQPKQQVVVKAGKPATPTTAFSLKTPPGKRALTIAIDSLAAVGGLVNPGDFVDIIAKLDTSEENISKKKKGKGDKETIVTVLFQNLQVLAVGVNFEPIGEDAPPYDAQQKAKKLNVTLAVSPEEAGLLIFAQTKGTFQLSLRSPRETEDKIWQQVASWEALADFVLENQGTTLNIPGSIGQPIEPKVTQETEELGEVKPYIQIFRGGRELGL